MIFINKEKEIEHKISKIIGLLENKDFYVQAANIVKEPDRIELFGPIMELKELKELAKDTYYEDLITNLEKTIKESGLLVVIENSKKREEYLSNELSTAEGRRYLGISQREHAQNAKRYILGGNLEEARIYDLKVARDSLEDCSYSKGDMIKSIIKRSGLSEKQLSSFNPDMLATKDYSEFLEYLGMQSITNRDSNAQEQAILHLKLLINNPDKEMDRIIYNLDIKNMEFEDIIETISEFQNLIDEMKKSKDNKMNYLPEVEKLAANHEFIKSYNFNDTMQHLTNSNNKEFYSICSLINEKHAYKSKYFSGLLQKFRYLYKEKPSIAENIFLLIRSSNILTRHDHIKEGILITFAALEENIEGKVNSDVMFSVYNKMVKQKQSTRHIKKSLEIIAKAPIIKINEKKSLSISSSMATILFQKELTPTEKRSAMEDILNVKTESELNKYMDSLPNTRRIQELKDLQKQKETNPEEKSTLFSPVEHAFIKAFGKN